MEDVKKEFVVRTFLYELHTGFVKITFKEKQKTNKTNKQKNKQKEDEGKSRKHAREDVGKCLCMFPHDWGKKSLSAHKK